MPAATKRQTAQAERNGSAKARVVKFEGLALTLSLKELPGTMLFDIAAIERDEGMAPIMDVLTRLLGDDQMEQVKGRVAARKLNVPRTIEALSKLFGDCLKAYGMTPGES